MKNFAAALLALTVFAIPARASMPDIDKFTGLWLTGKKDAGVELYRCEDKLCGRLMWLGTKDPGPEDHDGMDHKNPDKTKRKRPLCGMQFLGGFKPDESGAFEDGWLYNPRNGFKYSGKITPEGKDKLNLRGFILISLIGEEETWVRENRLPHCRSEQ